MVRSMVGIAILLCCAACGTEENAPTDQVQACSRAVLQTAVDSYLAAQEAGDLSKMLLAPQVAYPENMNEVRKEDGLWNIPLPIAFHRSFLDVEAN